ncbi:hypothetical protein EXU57_22965 [Segetibacter sp. 3557_3]|uniref:hypothetical protein n=1 Tax=Segetibacter sp. 3557_3 TaxID=2547429 RepID=UPI001058DE6B|nr:hypothetical protein [Segetibacter sp. 3557_3]TDH18466.1 hypothetical protein EXU57_22965 [Segetibacter sp. 3557_3]
MTLYQFNALSDAEKANHIWDRGQMAAVRYEPETSFLLYHLGSFYAEVAYTKEVNKIIAIKSFSNTGPLDSYLMEIDISEILDHL